MNLGWKGRRYVYAKSFATRAELPPFPPKVPWQTQRIWPSNRYVRRLTDFNNVKGFS